MSDAVSIALSRALADSSSSGILFEHAERYNHALEYTYRRTLRDVHSLGNDLKVLEIGSFTAVISVALKLLGHDVTASDMPFVLTDPGIENLLRKNEIPVIPSDLAHQPFPAPDEAFDLIIFNEVIEHLNFNPIPIVREFYRVLKPGGLVYCATPNLTSAKNRYLMLKGRSYINPVKHLVWNLAPDTGMSVGLHWREWSRSELIELFEVGGFQLQKHRFCLIIPNQSGWIRKSLVALLYKLNPSLMPGQVGVFKKEAKG